MGFKATTAPSLVHSNAVADGTVLSSDPAAGSKVASGSEITLTVAQNTALTNLVDTADKATWTATGTTSENSPSAQRAPPPKLWSTSGLAHSVPAR